MIFPFPEGRIEIIEVKKLMEEINRWSCKKNFYKKFLTRVIFLLAPAANHGWYKLFFIACMKRQHAVILEPIWERDSIIIHFPA